MTLAATLIGDVIASRTSPDRPALHAALQRAIESVNEMLDPIIPLRITVGDEYQGGFAALGQALSATLRLRLALAGASDVRHGVGWGEVSVLSEEPRVEDGPGWWAAREAIDDVKQRERRAAWRSLRTAFVLADGAEGPEPNAVNAALVSRDAMLARLDERGLSVLDGMLRGMTQEQIGRSLGITSAAVSQRVRRDGIAALVRVDELLGELR